MVRARVSSCRIPVRTFAHFGGTLAISRCRGRQGFVLAAFAGRPCAALVVVAAEPMVDFAAGAVMVGFSDAG